jgi:hypothetical protein
MNNTDNVKLLIESVLHDLAADAEALLLIAGALEDRASDVSSNASPQRLCEIAALVKAAALQMGLAAANVVGSAERLRLVAAFGEAGGAKTDGLPS